jgi:hypothetical protein
MVKLTAVGFGTVLFYNKVKLCKNEQTLISTINSSVFCKFFDSKGLGMSTFRRY